VVCWAWLVWTAARCLHRSAVLAQAGNPALSQLGAVLGKFVSLTTLVAADPFEPWIWQKIILE
jgi:hypothetical protein